MFTLRLQVRPREAASGTCCQRMQSKFILLLPTKYRPKMNILRSFLNSPPHHRFWKSYNCALMPFLIYPSPKSENVKSHNCMLMPFLPLSLNMWRLCVNTLVMWFPFSVILKNEGSTSKKCVNQIPNLLQTQDLKKGDLLGKGADAVVSIFLLPGNHKVCFRKSFDFKNNRQKFLLTLFYQI